MLMGALSIARSNVRIMSPYFLPDRELISAMVTAARRGVEIDIFVPKNNNLRLVDRAMTAQFDQMLRYGCRIWRVGGAFNHSKLMTVDGAWSYVGTSNLDPRSLRLNFEVDLEILDWDFAGEIERRIGVAMSNAEQVTLEAGATGLSISESWKRWSGSVRPICEPGGDTYVKDERSETI
jgi:cardiolipin synthase